MGKKKKKNGANLKAAKGNTADQKTASTDNKSFKLTRLISLLLSIMTVVMAVLSFRESGNWFYRIGMQASLGLFVLTNGIEAILIQRNRTKGAILMGVSALLLVGMIVTFYVGKKAHAF